MARPLTIKDRNYGADSRHLERISQALMLDPSMARNDRAKEYSKALSQISLWLREIDHKRRFADSAPVIPIAKPRRAKAAVG